VIPIGPNFREKSRNQQTRTKFDPVNDDFVKPELKSFLSRAVANRATAHDNSEHGLENWKPIFGQDHAGSKKEELIQRSYRNRSLGFNRHGLTEAI
jgi:hypothetical protein